MKKAIMIQGTHSNAGKSLVVTALCRIFSQDGYSVAPFKAQNMSLNAGVGIDGGEMGRAQITQAEAAGIFPHTDMNPVLLKPENMIGSQVILRGKVYGSMRAAEYYHKKQLFWEQVTASFDRLRQEYDIVVIEGAGSPAEINLKQNDIVNMRVALYANSPVILVGDIDRGGVFASLVGTVMLLEPQERELVKGFLINKFRGDVSLMGDGLERLQQLAYGIPTVGILPYLANHGIAEEDSVVLDEINNQGGVQCDKQLTINIMRYPHISNFDEFDSLAGEEGVNVRFISDIQNFGSPDAVILPGSKMTVEDLEWMKSNGLAGELLKYEQHGGIIAGICGGYQMMGASIEDLMHIETTENCVIEGLGILPIETSFCGEKVTVRTKAVVYNNHGYFSNLQGIELSGYQIHNGITRRLNGVSPMLLINGEMDGAIMKDGRTWGCYVHGLFENDAFRHSWLRYIGWKKEGINFDRQKAYDRLAAHFREHVNMQHIYQILNGQAG